MPAELCLKRVLLPTGIRICAFILIKYVVMFSKRVAQKALLYKASTGSIHVGIRDRSWLHGLKFRALSQFDTIIRLNGMPAELCLKRVLLPAGIRICAFILIKYVVMFSERVAQKALLYKASTGSIHVGIRDRSWLH
ncbi:hypothetical protein NDU88_001928 [Pleurodeles waltl]|uniref:Uncharacterized protein n=1 Tax=Pleurodeles waltl TaxID=8319 RepID=A0AAV7NCJ1_PLEWA|nr:hypothetical protein NDU88_001928 [Pleurodeles waltl]